jgi:hypothetical protein
MLSQYALTARDELYERIARDPSLTTDLFARLTAAQLERGLVHETRPICSFLAPLILDRALYERVARAAETLADALERVAAASLREPAILAELAPTEAEEHLARIDPGYERLCVASRLDSYLSDGGFWFFEYNGESPAGNTDQLLYEEIFFDLPHMREFLATHRYWLPRPYGRLLEALAETYAEWGGTKERPNIAIVDWADVATSTEFTVLKEYFESKGYPTIVTDPYNLEYSGGVLRSGDFEIDVFYKRVIIHEFFERFGESHALLRAYADRKVCMANSFRSKLAHKKASFAVLSDPRFEGLFTPDQVDVIRRHVPWTRRIREGVVERHGRTVELLDVLRRERERFVLKPNDDYGGHGVAIGWEASESEWDEAIDRALEVPFVAQERVPVTKMPLPAYGERVEIHDLLVDFDPFLFRNRCEGALVRVTETALSNVSSGGGVTALLVLEE